MSDEDTDAVSATSLSGLWISISRLLDEYGAAQPLAATVINLAVTAVGITAYVMLDGLPAYAGAIIAIWSALAILKWVIPL